MTAASLRAVTLGQVIERVFPEGTRWTHSGEGIEEAPNFPPDLFAIASHLLHLAGAYHYFVPCGEPSEWPASSVCLSKSNIEEYQTAGDAWRAKPIMPARVQELWRRLLDARNLPLYVEPLIDHPPPGWWRDAHALLVVADEACADIGYVDARSSSTIGEGSNWIVETIYSVQFKLYGVENGENHLRIRPQTASLCLKADRDVVCVQPKARTPEVGCTLRTLSHNVCHLPPRGVMRAHWQRPPFDPLPEAGTTINLLLIPLPFTLDARSFEHKLTGSSGSTDPQWGWFEVKQDWLVDEIVDFTMAMVREARKACAQVHGVVFPELALDWPTYERLAERLRLEARDVEFLVSGSSSNCARETGNFALSSQFFEIRRETGEKSRIVATTSRAKHHRWRLNGAQIESYNLGRRLPKDAKLWERINLPQREIHVNVVRKSSVFTTMICEDLARSDPCHEVLRSLGPNLVIALLMDGPQLQARWSARYATGLADDPGSSVLTFTSRGLLARSNEGRTNPNWSVALWKDDTGTTTEIDCPPDKHGVVLMLTAQPVTEGTLDDRQNSESYAWRLEAVPRHVALPANDPTLKALRET